MTNAANLNTPSSKAGQALPSDPDAVPNGLSQIEIGAPQKYRNLSVFPLIAKDARSAAYITLDEALDRHVAMVTEVSEGGVVPELRFENKGVAPVLLVDGEELVGARQNRVLNLTILVGAHTELVIPVSCVEAGRWSYNSRHFGSANCSLFAAARAAKIGQVSESLRDSGMRRSNQGAIWNDISAKAARFGTRSATEAMSDIYMDASGNVHSYTAAISCVPGQVGGVFAVNDQIFGVELFNSPSTYQKLSAKLVSSYAMEALDQECLGGGAVDAEAVSAFLGQIAAAATETFEAVGQGTDLRLRGTGIVGAGLVVDDQIVHLSAFMEPA